LVPVNTPPPAADHAGPLVRIEPAARRVSLDLRELLLYRELLFFLAWRDVKVRYKQTVLGVAWAVLQPLLAMTLFTLVFGRLAKVPSDGIPYPLFSFAALLPWTFFSNAVTTSGTSVVGSAQLITKVYFPRLIIPGAAVAATLVDFAIALGLLAVLMIAYGAGVGPGVLLMLPLVLLTVILALGVGAWTAAMTVRYRDFRHALPFAMQLWLFATPVIYPASLVPSGWRPLLMLNPLTGIIEGYRAALFGRPLDGASLALSTVVSLLALWWGARTFRGMERTFADII
jgi:lipopolysaccharide transport system permease protein